MYQVNVDSVVRDIATREILEFYRVSWSEYDHKTLIDQTKELPFPPQNAKSLSKEELINCLLQEDVKNLNTMTNKELSTELKAQKTN